MSGDLRLDRGDRRVEPVDVGLQVFRHDRVDPGRLLQADALTGTLGDQLVAPPAQFAKPFALRLGRNMAGRIEPGADLGQKGGIDPVGLGQPAGGLGVAAGLERVDAAIGPPGAFQTGAQCPVIRSGRLEDDGMTRIEPGQPGADRNGGVGDAGKAECGSNTSR